MINLGKRRELFIDKKMIDLMDGTFMKLHEPVPCDAAIKLDKPWDGCDNFADCVIELDGKYLMYYRAMKLNMGVDAEFDHCVAFSEDGIIWTKPILQPEGTNFVTCQDECPSGVVFKEFCTAFVDRRPGVSKSERVKAFCSVPCSGERHTVNNDPGGAKKLVFFASEDGLHFHLLNPQPEFRSELFNAFDGGVSMFWSEEEQQYVFYYRYSQCFRRSTNDSPHMIWRNVARATSKDFYTWVTDERMLHSEMQEQIYVNNTEPYFRAPHIYLGAAARFMEWSNSMSGEKAKKIPFGMGDEVELQENIWEYFTRDCSDGILLTTRPGSNVYDNTFMETFIRGGLESGDWTSRTNYPLRGIIPYDDTTMFMYVNRRYLQPEWHVQRLALRIDGFASVSAPYKGGTITTKPFTFEGNELEINYRTGAAGYIRVELLDEEGNVYPDFQGRLCEKIVGNEIKRIVRWRTDIREECLLEYYAGKTVRLRFYMKDADLFSFKFN